MKVELTDQSVLNVLYMRMLFCKRFRDTELQKRFFAIDCQAILLKLNFCFKDSVLFYPCKHRITCQECCEMGEFVSCPTCRAEIHLKFLAVPDTSTTSNNELMSDYIMTEWLRCKVEVAYEAKDPAHISLNVGDIVRVIECDPDPNTARLRIWEYF